MSDAVEPAAPSAPPVETAVELPIPLAAFAATLRPRPTPVLRDGKPVRLNGKPVVKFAPAHADEIWLKLLKIRHGTRRLTPTQWRDAIDAIRDEAVHSSDPRTK